MILIDAERCNGCGLCVEACPVGAIYLVDGKAQVDETSCQECGTCVGVCPLQSIACVRRELATRSEAVGVVTASPKPATIELTGVPTTPSWRVRIWPALAWAGRELVPPVAGYVLSQVNRWAGRSLGLSAEERGAPGRGAGAAWQHRHRSRGGK